MDYKLEINSISKEAYNETLHLFQDSNLYQSYEYNLHAKGGRHMCTVVLKKGDKILGVSIVRIVKLPFFNFGLAYIYRGPVWQRKNIVNSIEILSVFLKLLKEEFVLKRKLVLRISPNLLKEKNMEFENLFNELGFTSKGKYAGSNTFYIDASLPLEELKKNLSGNWRKKLKKSENENLRFLSGREDSLYQEAEKLYLEMVKRKRFDQGIDVNKLKTTQVCLPSSLKMISTICYSKDVPISCLVFSAVGSTGIPILAATSDSGTNYNGSYLLHWQMLVYLNENGYKCFDLGGIDKEKNPNVYNFKHGMGGVEVHFLDVMDFGSNKFFNSILKRFELVKKFIR
ncbi:MAG: peptidoglycan bridge formation glycyltransferase FemA/FemB family protein [Ignavibacteriales bacterium]|nr:peptidoglycan bridge formation glycyltransferase FemA/FemB family protein [Ignavibacteriales bacterium]